MYIYLTHAIEKRSRSASGERIHLSRLQMGPPVLDRQMDGWRGTLYYIDISNAHDGKEFVTGAGSMHANR